MTREEALIRLRKQRQKLEARGVAHAALFGSLARGEARASSDVDVLILPEAGRRLDLIELGGVQSILEEAFPGKEVDVVIGPPSNPDLREAIGRDRLDAF